MKPKSRRIKKQDRHIFLPILLIALVVGAAGLLYHMLALSKQIEERFAGRKWDIPSKVYSDTTLLYMGQRINRAQFLEKLERLGYQKTAQTPRRPGELKTIPGKLLLDLHEFSSPTYTQKPQPVQITLQGDTVASITNRDTGEVIPLLTLEPEELMLYYGPDRERRKLLSIDKVPPQLIHAILAAEDHRFYTHHGFELRGIFRALLTNLKAGGIRQGGSTITQQLAKNYFLTPDRTFRRKIKELLISVILEYRYSKDEILEMYLNEIYCGQKGAASVNGMGEAAQFYFDKTVDELSIAEDATLAGLIRAPNLYSPHRNPEACLERRNLVLAAMKDQGWLTEEELKKAQATPLKATGVTSLGRSAPYYMDYVTDQLSELYSHETLTSEGLSIFTTLDTQVQIAAEEALSRGLARLEAAHPKLKRDDPEKQLQGAVIVMQPKTGYIIAMAGGRNYGFSQFNRATQAMRQPGSAFKPFVYLAALDTHKPTDVLENTPRIFMVDGKPWAPKNYEGDAPGEVTLREAIAESQNVATVGLALSIGLDTVGKTAQQFLLPVKAPFYPSMVIGATEVSPLSLARAYCAFAADGVLPFPLSIKDVADESGAVVESRHAQIERLITPAKAYMMNDLLRGVVLRGTASSLRTRGVDWPVAGKTGTTNDSRDAWFVGYTPDILALVWVGFDNGDSMLTTGAQAALPIWAELMTALPQYVSGEWFTQPEGITKVTLCRESGMIANQGCCPEIATEIFLSGMEPTESCDRHTCQSPIQKAIEGIKRLVPKF